MKKKGHEQLFLGGGPIRGQAHSAFSEAFHVSFGSHLRIVYDSRIRKRWLKQIDAIKPDVVHAHNLIAAAMMLDTDYPVIYDDHEYWSKQDFRFETRPFLRRMAGKPLISVTPKWERSILESYPVLTVSENIAKEHREIASHVEVTHNYPLCSEVEGLTSPERRVGAVYIGSDFQNTRFSLHRDMTGLQDILNFDILTGISHREMMNTLTKYKVGLTPWLPHPFHKYCDPNKNYEYLNAGLQVLITYTLGESLTDNPYVHPFKTYDELPELVHSLSDVPGPKIMNHARTTYVWEANSPKIHRIYDYARPS